jgi:hypothetical protein
MNSILDASSVISIGLFNNTASTGSFEAVYIGRSANASSKFNNYAVAIGSYANESSLHSPYGVSIGSNANRLSVSGAYVISIGDSAGRNTSGSAETINIGVRAGEYSSGSAGSINIGYVAGTQTTASVGTINIGYGAGYSTSQSFSINIGVYAGYSNVSSRNNNNIIIGNSLSAPVNYSEFLNIGGVLFATGTHRTADPYSDPNTITSSLSNVAKIGILTPLPKYTLDVSGSGNFSNGLIVTGSLIATSSQAVSSSYALTASYALNGGVGGTSLGIARTGSLAGSNISVVNFLGGGIQGITISGATASIEIAAGAATSASYALTASFATSASWAPGGSAQAAVRTTTFMSTSVLAQSVTETGSVSLSKGFILYRVATTVPARIRLYLSTPARNADITRGTNVEPTGSHELIVDVITTANSLTSSLSPIPYGAVLDEPVTTNVPYTITNLQTGSVAVTASFTFLPLE